ncbi:hypothetical protein [Stenotrophomonas sp. PS02289]|uniref:hypothetical protein n=1 Tax=Stenotrophomonas sp. PS02289 TaxID=2991422 RepID=UPI002499B662|nr:hypothetical protein [Stenotrophomonas sp. PS02289]
MSEHPILFNGPMVRAILDGRKTQTRRVVKLPPGFDFNGGMGADPNDPSHWTAEDDSGQWWTLGPADERFHSWPCPFGRPGERLWVRETWQGPLVSEQEMDEDGYWARNIARYQDTAHCVYAADGAAAPEWVDADGELPRGWRPSIHMPRWACRLLVEITAVRVERLHAISEADAVAEGIDHERMNGYALAGRHRSAGFAFQDLWTSTGGTWVSNPWVWVIEFKRIQA